MKLQEETMPKVFFSKQKKLNDRFASWVYGQMKLKHISQRMLAEELQITQQALSYKLKKHQFSFADFITIVDVLEPDPSELAWLVGRKGSI